MLPMFTAFGFESAIILKREGAKLMSIVIKAMAILSMTFSLTVIIIGQFEKNMDIINAQIDAGQAVEINTTEYEFNLTERDRITKELETLISQSDEQQQKMDKIEFN